MSDATGSKPYLLLLQVAVISGSCVLCSQDVSQKWQDIGAKCMMPRTAPHIPDHAPPGFCVPKLTKHQWSALAEHPVAGSLQYLLWQNTGVR